MKKADGWEEIVETWAECPYCFQNVSLYGNKYHHEDEIVQCPKCENEFRLGESA